MSDDNQQLDIAGEMEKAIIEQAINEFVGDKKDELKKLFEKLLEKIDKNNYYFLYHIGDKVYFAATDKENVTIDVKDTEKLKVTELTDYVNFVKNI